MSMRNDKSRGHVVVCNACGRDGPRMQTAASAGTVANRAGWRSIKVQGTEKNAHVCPSCFREWRPAERLAEFVKRKRRDADNNTRE